MAEPNFMPLTGPRQGLITAGAFTADSVGNTYQEGHEDQVMVQGFSHEVIIPRDPQSGQPTGQRVHKPVKITKVFDKSSPLLLAALTSGERLTEIDDPVVPHLGCRHARALLHHQT
jgi:type VI secretion system secreted protein Hcp